MSEPPTNEGGTLGREQSREEMRQILVCWNAAQLEQLQEVANAILDDKGATLAISPAVDSHEFGSQSRGERLG